MSGKKTAENLVVQVIPAPPHPPKIDLHNSSAIRREMASVYRDMRSGSLPAADGTKLVYVLSQLGEALERDLLEKRIEELEKQNDDD